VVPQMIDIVVGVQGFQDLLLGVLPGPATLSVEEKQSAVQAFQQ
jgi:hypothetical protein